MPMIFGSIFTKFYHAPIIFFIKAKYGIRLKNRINFNVCHIVVYIVRRPFWMAFQPIAKPPEFWNHKIKFEFVLIVSFQIYSNDYVSPLDIRTEEQLWKHINHSVHQADAGVGEDADAVIDELQQEFTA